MTLSILGLKGPEDIEVVTPIDRSEICPSDMMAEEGQAGKLPVPKWNTLTCQRTWI